MKTPSVSPEILTAEAQRGREKSKFFSASLRLCGFALMMAVQAEKIYPQAGGRIFETRISPSLSIVREINPPSPFVGQQFTIIYSLHALKIPVAVDIEPQQYSHFWTEIIPLKEQPRTVARIVQGRARHEFVLRQVVAYPLSAGLLELPPLALKIKTMGNLVAGSDNWDLIARSRPDFVRVQPLPPEQERTGRAVFVGSISGQWSEIPTAHGHEIRLEMRGNANLAFFHPEDWVRSRGGFYLSSRLASAESEVQTKDIGGNRQLLVTNGQRWSIRVFPSGKEPLRLDDLVIPVFQPESETWSTIRIRGFPLRASAADAQRRNLGELQAVPRDDRISPARYILLLVTACAVVAASILWLVLKSRGRQKGSPSQRSATRELGNLRKQSGKAPRSFLETAHRVLQRYAEEHHLIPQPGNEDTAFQRCWTWVERSRFVAVDPSPEEQARLLQSLQSLLGGEVGPSELTAGQPSDSLEENS